MPNAPLPTQPPSQGVSSYTTIACSLNFVSAPFIRQAMLRMVRRFNVQGVKVKDVDRLLRLPEPGDGIATLDADVLGPGMRSFAGESAVVGVVVNGDQPSRFPALQPGAKDVGAVAAPAQSSRDRIQPVSTILGFGKRQRRATGYRRVRFLSAKGEVEVAPRHQSRTHCCIMTSRPRVRPYRGPSSMRTAWVTISSVLGRSPAYSTIFHFRRLEAFSSRRPRAMWTFNGRGSVTQDG